MNQRLKFVYRNKNCLSLQSRKTLCSTLIQCHFDYACACWYEGLTKNMKDKLQIAQNKIIRFLLNLHHRKIVTYIEFEKLWFLNICNRVKQLRLMEQDLVIVYTYWLLTGYEGIASLLSPRHWLLTEGTTNLLFPNTQSISILLYRKTLDS